MRETGADRCFSYVLRLPNADFSQEEDFSLRKIEHSFRFFECLDTALAELLYLKISFHYELRDIRSDSLLYLIKNSFPERGQFFLEPYPEEEVLRLWFERARVLIYRAVGEARVSDGLFREMERLADEAGFSGHTFFIPFHEGGGRLLLEKLGVLWRKSGILRKMDFVREEVSGRDK